MQKKPACWWRHKGLFLASRQLKADQHGLIALNAKGETVWQNLLCVRGHSSGFVETGVIEFPDGDFKPLDYNNLSGGQLAWVTPDKIMMTGSLRPIRPAIQ
jgi:hypothetical protein